MKICEYKPDGWTYYGPAKIWQGFSMGPDRWVTRHNIRVTCPLCKRRMKAQAKFCHDGCCIYIRVPSHKKKRWWK